MAPRFHRFGLLAAVFLAIPVLADEAQICQGFGPQSPRDITEPSGVNPVVFSQALAAEELSFCDMHLHKNAEHKGPGFPAFIGPGRFGGYRCKEVEPSAEVELKHCVNVSPGDTIEVHWAYTSCDVEPRPGLPSCLPETCVNPQLRVEAQVFLVARGEGHDLARFTPSGDGTVTYLGSTTGYQFNAEACSSLQVTWSVPANCLKVDFDSLGRWCANNPFNERRAHGVRPLVTDLELLSEIRK